MKRRRLVKVVAVVVAVPVLLVTIALLYLNFADLGGWRDTVAGLASDAIGRELRINGEFQPEIGFTTRVVATNISLANADWSNDPQMVSADRLAGEIDLLSVLFGPITIRDVEITGARVLFELDAEGRFNWALGSGESSGGGDDDVELVISHALVTDLQLVWAPPGDQPLQAALAHFEFTDDGTGMLDLDLEGRLEGTPLEISGRLGTFIGLINAAAVEHDLTGRFADAEFSLQGKIGDLGSLTGVDGDVSANGPELSHITDSFGLDPVIEGPFTVEASVRQSGAGSDFDLEVAAAGISAKVTGVTDSLTDPSSVDATVTASGPSIRTVGALTGVADLPAEEFSVSGGLRWEGFPITFNELEIMVGDNTLSADGVLGAPPQMLGTDFTIRGKGPNVSSIGALAGIDLPRDRFSIGGRVVRVAGGLQVDAVEAHVGRTTLRAEGMVGDPPDYAGTTLTLHAEGPNIAHFKNLIGKELPAEPFAIDGRLVEGNEAIAFQGVNARLGGASLRVDGFLKTAKGLTGTSLRIEAKGPDAAQLSTLIGLNDLPAEAWSVEGGVAILDSGLRLDGVSATVGSLEAHGDGLLSTTKGLVGTDLQIHIEDTDLSHPAAIAGFTRLPRDGFTVDSRVRIEASGYRLDGFKAAVGDMELEVDGQIGAPPELEGTQVHFTARGPRLSSLNLYLDQTGLPPAPFSVAGNARVTEDAYGLDSVVAEVDGNRLTVDGIVRPAAGFVGTDLEIAVSAPDLARAGRLAAGFAELPALPAEPFTLDTGLEIEEHGYKIENLRATLANAAATIDGRVGSPPELVGTDLTIDSDGPNASLFTALTGVTIPVAPFRLRGRFQRTAAGYQFDRVSIQLGDYLADVHGSVGEPPRLVGTDVELRASGPSLALVGELAGLEQLPDELFRVGGRFKGTPELFTTDGLEIALGDSDLSGSLEVDIRGKPAAIVNLKSKHLDLSPFMKPLLGGGDGDQDEEVASSRGTGGTAISNEPIDFGPLQRADADVTIKIGTLLLPLKRFREVELGARLSDGRLEVHRFSVVGQREDRGSGTLVLEPVGDDYRLHTVLDFDALRLDLPGEGSADPASEPPIDLDVRLDVVGKSPHGFASTADGSVQMVVGKGVMDNQILDLITADILLTLLTAFNPFAKEDAATELQCAVFLVSLEEGLATLEPMALQSDKMTMLGKGKIDLGTEKLDLEWITKPRKGIGISASMITNPYIKLGGTLSNPSVQMKGMEAVASTGAAVATMGISLVAKGFLDRITAEKKVCKKALEEISRQSDPASKKSKKKRR